MFLSLCPDLFFLQYTSDLFLLFFSLEEKDTRTALLPPVFFLFVRYVVCLTGPNHMCLFLSRFPFFADACDGKGVFFDEIICG